MSTLRFKAIEAAFNRKVTETTLPSTPTSAYYGKRVFSRTQMAKYLPHNTMQHVIDAIDNGTSIGREVANDVAKGMKEWALSMGATHYSHWFQPLTDGTAEKHDSFIEIDSNEGVIEDFSGKLLVQQEPDASSFPNGGIRNTFEARGYTAWDPSSPAFIVDDTLCVPTVFIAYTGEALDYKTPLLRSINSLSKAALGVCQYFDKNVKKVTPFLGWEQEYFLVDEALYMARPDLMLCGRTLMGHESAKNQQLEDHYFGAIPSRVAAFMRELEYEAYTYGIPLKTRHNEVAPNQFEFAPIYGEMNLANDHNQLIMSIMDKVACKHSFRVLLHEKPFAGVNGSGKHNNWSMGTDTGVGLLTPGKTPTENVQFITFLVNTLMAVHKHNSLIKASIMTANNSHRLGANEAPPAIISVFLGSQLSAVLKKLEKSTSEEAIVLNEKKMLSLGIAHIPEVLLDNTDRNRTSPFAFTGNRFEFRALGSSANCAVALIALNSAVASQLKEFKASVDAQIQSGMSKEQALFAIIRKYIRASKSIHFEGNGYSDEWRKEAELRKLDCQSSVPKSYDAYLTKGSIKMFAEAGVFNDKELHARNEVKWEVYTKKVQIEARVLGDLALNHVIPVATRYQSILLENVYRMQSILPKEKAETLVALNIETIEKIALHISDIRENVGNMIKARKLANKIESEREKAINYESTVVPYFASIRKQIDKLEMIVDDEMWTLPKYRELLFIR
ncbi:MAG: glutamine synthetase III [Bacteroidales bacterium]